MSRPTVIRWRGATKSLLAALFVVVAVVLTPAVEGDGASPESIAGPTASVTPACSGGVRLSVAPTAGPAPLLVNFVATLPTPTGPPAISWQFGDGTYWNGTGLQFDSVSHLYGTPGHFTSLFASTFGSTTSRCSVTITVGSERVVPTIATSAFGGRAPLAVTFSGSAVGGSGTYARFAWTFGDGSNSTGVNATHTFRSAGEFTVRLNVTDTNGSSGEASLEVAVSPNSDGGAPPLSIVVGILPWALTAFAVALAIAFALLLGQRRKEARSLPEYPKVGGSPGPKAPGIGSPTSSDEGGPADPILRAPGAAVPAPKTPSAESVRISQRIVLHLARQGPLRPAELATPAFSQAGVQEAVRASRGSVSNSLRRLESAGIVRSEVRHVEGGNRRVRVYLLSDRGWALAEELRKRRR